LSHLPLNRTDILNGSENRQKKICKKTENKTEVTEKGIFHAPAAMVPAPFHSCDYLLEPGSDLLPCISAYPGHASFLKNRPDFFEARSE
jgi:hypothetical protein